jgi:hypothetical protein
MASLPARGHSTAGLAQLPGIVVVTGFMCEPLQIW